MLKSKIILLAVLLVMLSCNSKNLPDLKTKYDGLKREYFKELKINDSLIQVLNSLKKEYGLDKQVIDESEKLLSRYKLALTRVKTGYYVSEFENLFLPAITLEFRNLSQNDFQDNVVLDVYFINNKTGEQISTDYNFFANSSTVLMGGLTKQVTLKSKIGWNVIPKQDISVRLYINNQFFKLYKIENTEYFGRL
jgi:hypothetical protein